MLVRWSGRPALVSRWLDSDPWLATPTVPAVDVAEDVQGYTIAMELPGVKAGEITIGVDRDRLTIAGEKKQETEEKTDRLHRIERRFGSFQRGFALPESVDRDGIEAKLSDGVLTVKLPKTAKAQPRSIPVVAQ